MADKNQTQKHSYTKFRLKLRCTNTFYPRCVPPSMNALFILHYPNASFSKATKFPRSSKTIDSAARITLFPFTTKQGRFVSQTEHRNYLWRTLQHSKRPRAPGWPVSLHILWPSWCSEILQQRNNDSSRDVIYIHLIWELAHVDHVCSDFNGAERHWGSDFD